MRDRGKGAMLVGFLNFVAVSANFSPSVLIEKHKRQGKSVKMREVAHKLETCKPQRR